MRKKNDDEDLWFLKLQVYEQTDEEFTISPWELQTWNEVFCRC